MKNETAQSRDEVFRSWCKVLDPNTLRTNLQAIGVYLVAFEILKLTVVDQPRSLVTLGLDGDEMQDAYREDVLSRDRSPFRASMLWFKEMGAIDDNDMVTADEIRRHRNDLAHRIPEYLTSVQSNFDVSLFDRMLALISKIDRWWIREIELDCNSDFDHVDRSSIPDEEIISGKMLLVQTVLNCAFGDLDAATLECEKFVEGVLSRKKDEGDAGSDHDT